MLVGQLAGHYRFLELLGLFPQKKFLIPTFAESTILLFACFFILWKKQAKRNVVDSNRTKCVEEHRV
jgi:hypothetical protein